MATRLNVPFLDLERQSLNAGGSLDYFLPKISRVVKYIGGDEITEFEHAFEKILLSSHVIPTANGTDSLFIGLKMLGVQPNDEVLTPAFSCIPSAETISLCHAKPVFVDIDPKTYTIDPKKIEEKITSNTKGIIAVHLYGQAAHVEEINSICKKHNLFLIEDCAQAHLTQENGKYAGTFGDAGAFSFYPTKNLGAYGDAGCIITDNGDLAEKMRRFANHGALEEDDHLIEGMNSRMDTFQAAVLLAKLPNLKQWNEQRRANASLYNSLLSGVGEIQTPYVRPDTYHTFHIYAIRAKRRDELKKFLLEEGVQTIIHYPKALPNLPAYKYLNHKPEHFPVASKFECEQLSLPIYPELTEEQIKYVCDCVVTFYTKK
jgi:dTDP-4-amino-4,6-dideoxygalactose transaminase